MYICSSHSSQDYFCVNRFCFATAACLEFRLEVFGDDLDCRRNYIDEVELNRMEFIESTSDKQTRQS